MEHIRQAVERANAPRGANGQPEEQTAVGNPVAARSAGKAVILNAARLESRRIVAHDTEDPRSRPFDMLRTQVLQSMDIKSWQLLGITSPTEACGKSVISINLALSIARQRERSVLLVDMDMQRPQIAANLGLKCDRGILSILEGRTTLANSLIQARIRDEQFFVLPCEASTHNSSDWMASRSMSALMQDIKRDFRGYTVIFDFPPILPSDDVISILPQIDCALLVTAAGTSTKQEIRECNKHLESTPIVRVVLNKATDVTANYYSYSRYANHPAARGRMGKKGGYNPFRSGRMRALFSRLARY